MFGSCFALFFVAIFYEGLKFIRNKLVLAFSTGMNLQKEKNVKNINSTTLETSEKVSIKMNSKLYFKYYLYEIFLYFNNFIKNVFLLNLTFRNIFRIDHLVQSVLYALQFSIGYILMLAFMTFNYWLCFAILLGIWSGYFVFGLEKSKYITNEECCL